MFKLTEGQGRGTNKTNAEKALLSSKEYTVYYGGGGGQGGSEYIKTIDGGVQERSSFLFSHIRN